MDKHTGLLTLHTPKEHVDIDAYTAYVPICKLPLYTNYFPMLKFSITLLTARFGNRTEGVPFNLPRE